MTTAGESPATDVDVNERHDAWGMAMEIKEVPK